MEFTQQLEMQLYQIATFLKEDIKQKLEADGHRATGELIESINTVVSKGSDMFVIEGMMGKTGEYIIKGRAIGEKGVPLKALQDWIDNKNFSSGITDKSLLKIKTEGKYAGTSPLAYLIQRGIKEKGIKPDDFIGKVFEKDRDLIYQKLQSAAYDALNVSLTNLINNANKVI